MVGQCRVFYLGRYDYKKATALQERLVRQRTAAVIPDTLLLLSHPPVFTIGRKGTRANILVNEEVLLREGIAVHETDRGGDITYHGPGQLVGYAILDLRRHGQDLHRLIHNYEEVIIRVLNHYGIEGRRFEEYPGVWVRAAKICALGIAVSNWVCYHGFALNIEPNMEHFSYILPCGIRELGVTSLSRVLGRPVPEREVAAKVASSFGDVFSMRMLTETSLEKLCQAGSEAV
ncbi:MAG TPA: lipoyl(octanoyl) transferase LipB [Spirochaetia bacterium]|nr:lipoyl(octanoyl) transferase LipB [Spirochaetia bacterium]